MSDAILKPIDFMYYRRFEKPADFCSNSCSFLYIIDGTAQIELNNDTRKYEKNDFLMLLPKETCQISSHKNTVILFLGLSFSFIQDYMRSVTIPVCNSCLFQDQDYVRLKQLICQIAGCYENEDNSVNLSVIGLVFLLLAELKNHSFVAKKYEPDSQVNDRIRDIILYIDSHYSESLSLSKLAEAFYLTPQYLSTALKKSLSVTFKTHLTERRLFFAAGDLRNSTLPVNEIAFRNGFPSMSSFRKHFHRVFGMAPAAYRREYISKKQTDKSPAPILSDPVLHNADIGCIQNNYILDASGVVSKRDKTETMINIGSAQNLMSEKYRTRLLDFRKLVPFRYIRLQEIICSSFIPMLLPDYHYYMQKVDIVVSFLYENGIFPFIELSRRQFDYTAGKVNRGSIMSIQRNARYYKLLEGFLIHVSQNWPHTWLKNWKFELWMSPDDSLDAYTCDFKKIQLLINQYLPQAKLGGPGYSPCFTKTTPDIFLREFRERNIVPDFFSAHLNYMVPEETSDGTYLLISNIMNSPEDLCTQIKQMILSSGLKLPLYITEWTSADIPDSPILYSRYQAAFIAKMMLSLDQISDMSAYWYFCDTRELSFRQSGSSSYFMFGKGLSNLEFSPGAPYYSYLFCNQLDDNILDEGDHYRFTKSVGNNYHLLMYHYEHFQSGVLSSCRQTIRFDHLYDLFQNGPDIYASINIVNLKPGLYRVRRLLIDQFHGSMLDIMIGEFTHSKIDAVEFLQKMKAPENFEHNYLAQACVPEERIAYAESDGTLHLTASLPAHTVCLWDIQLQV